MGALQDREDLVIEEAKRILLNRLRARRCKTMNAVFNTPEVAGDYLMLERAALPYEVFGILILDNAHRLIENWQAFTGTIAAATVYPREIVKRCLDQGGAAVVLYHNHPSGVCEPSRADDAMTYRLRDALAMVDIRVLDHIVVGEGWFSYSQARKL